jgi:hypothetical protein
MPDVGHGEALYKGLLDYPLPQQAGVRDYVFYLAGIADPGYGQAAKYLFDTFYGQHHPVTDVASLEGVIRALYTDVTQHGVQQIREIVIVAHGTPIGMNFPVLDSTVDRQMMQVTPLSLSDLQDQFRSGELATFAAQRTAVLQHLAPEAWVTIRVCRFGQSDEGMYALYSFFGGAVNVYAPVKYQMFASVFLEQGARFPDRLAYHEHLMRQRFLPRGRHTPNRAKAIVAAMENPQSFSVPFVVAASPVPGPEAPAYSACVDGLNRASVTAALRDGFHQAGFDLSGGDKVKVKVVERDGAWEVGDVLTEDQAEYPVRYSVSTDLDTSSGQVRLLAQGTVVGDGADVPLQALFDDFEHAQFFGELFSLAYHAADDPADADNLVRFNALSALLAQNGESGSTFSTGDVDLGALLADENPDFAPADSATITLLAQPPDGSTLPTVWLIEPTAGGIKLEIRLVHMYTDARKPSRVYTVIRHFDVPEGAKFDPAKVSPSDVEAVYRAEVLSWAGTDTDSPGVELAASLDRLSLDDLADLITFLHSSYDPARVVVLHQAHQALHRKAGFGPWELARFPNADDIPFPSGDPLTELSLGEKDDLAERVYPFWFAGNWREVKESVLPRPVFTKDLFLEESLTDRFSNLDSWTDVYLPSPDSPSSDARARQGQRTPGQQRYAATTVEKETFRPPDDRASCDEFRTAIRKLKELQDLPADQLSAALAQFSTSEGVSYLHIAIEVAETYGILRNLAFLTELAKLPEIPANTYEAAKFIAKPVFEHLGWEVGVKVLELLEDDVVVLIPWEMWKHFLEVQAEGVERNEAYGRLTGARTWLVELDDLARRHPAALTASMTIDLSGRSDAQVMQAYEYELNDGVHTRFMLDIEDFHHGFDEGGTRMQELWPEILRIADEAMSKALYASVLDSCRTTVLVDEGFVDLGEVRAAVIRQLVQRLLSELPHV